MYNYFEDKNLNEVYEYLKKLQLFDYFIETIALEKEDYKKLVNEAKNYKKDTKATKKEAVERNENATSV